MTPTPPRLAEWLLRLVLPADRHETISGDLAEMFHDVAPQAGRRYARRWYWRQTISIAIARLRARPPRAPLTPPRQGDPMHGLRQDLQYAVRTLLKTPGFTLMAVLTLALGIGANTAIFSLVNGLLLEPLPFTNADRLMLVHITGPDYRATTPGAFRDYVWSYKKYQDVLAEQQSFEDSALFSGRQWSLTGTDSPERMQVEVVTGRYLSVLGITPLLGRDILPAEDRSPGIEKIVLISHALWQRRFGGDPHVLGRTLGLNAIPHTIVGVLPAGFRGLTGVAQAWVPIMAAVRAAEPGGDGELTNPNWHSYYFIARRKAAVAESQAQSEIAVIGARLSQRYPNRATTVPYSARATALNDARVDPLIRRSALVLVAAVGLVLLIGCVNLANLMLARGVARQREIAIRLAIGATRGRLVRQLLTESVLLAALGAVAGLAVAIGAMRLTSALMPETAVILRSETFGLTRIGISLIDLDLTTLLFTIGVAGLTAVLFGLVPAWHASRADIVQTIKQGGMGSVGTGTRGLGLRTLLIVGETALALVLLVASGLMLQSVGNLQRTEIGFQPDGLLTMRLSLPDAQYDEARASRLFSDLLERVRALPGVQAAAYGNCVPVSGSCNGTRAWFPDRPPLPAAEQPTVGVFWASEDYFTALGARVVRGRDFTDRDRVGQPKVVVINETAARRLFEGGDPIGRRIGVGQGRFDDATVIGVVNDVRYRNVESAPDPDVYIPLRQSPTRGGVLFVRTRLEAASLTTAIRREIAALDRDLPVSDVKTMDTRVGDATWRTRLSADLLGLFAALALLLAAVGLYGVMTQAVAQRTREIGIRLALGAGRQTIFTLVIGRALVMSLAGVALGVALSLLSMRFLDALLYQVEPNDPITLTALAAVLLGVALLASYVPARRATRVDPLTSLRAE